MESIDLTLFINLDRRIDRLKEIQEVLSHLPLKKVERFPAIEHSPGAIGCTKSHIACLKMAIERKVDTLFICEDDLMIDRPEVLNANLKTFLASETPWDVIFVAGNVLFPIVEHSPVAYQVKNCQTTTGYIVKSHYFQPLLKNFQISLSNSLRRPKDSRWCLDMNWKVLQKKDRWFIIRPLTSYQRDSYSDIEQRITSYRNEMLKVGVGNERRVIVNLQGGTGNQLFQVAYAFALANRMGGIACRSCVECKSLSKHTGVSKLLHRLPKKKPIGKILKQKGWTFDEHDDSFISSSTDQDIYLTGYYQSSKFFIREGLTSLLKLILPILHSPRLHSNHPPLLKTHATIVLHIRRGDYLKHPDTHPVLTKQYYVKAVEHLRTHIKKPIRIIVCSDDLKWCQSRPWLSSLSDKLCFPKLNVIQTLSLMERSSFIVIANSTLSWWGAFLACQRDSDTKVVAPSTWFGSKVKHDTRDMYEPSWYVI